VRLYQLGNVSVGLVVFPEEDSVNLLMPNHSSDSLCRWHKKKFEMAADTDWSGLYVH